MENTYWIKYIHSVLVERGILPEAEFEFTSISDSSHLTYGDRNNVRLVNAADMVERRPVGRVEISSEFTNALEKEFVEQTPNGIALSMAKIGANLDEYDNLSLHIPADQIIRWNQKKGICDTFTVIQNFNATVLRIGLERNLLPIKGKVSFNTGVIYYASPSDVVLQALHFGEDFSALNPFGYWFSRKHSQSREQEAVMCRVETKRFSAIARKSPLNNLPPEEAADSFIEVISRLHSYCDNLVRII